MFNGSTIFDIIGIIFVGNMAEGGMFNGYREKLYR